MQLKLNVEMQAALNNPAVRKKLFDAAWEPVPSDAAAMAAYTAAETRVWHKLIKDQGISLE